MKKNNIELNIPDTNDFKYVKQGLFVLLFMFGGLILWAALVPLSASSAAPGKVVPTSGVVSIQSLDGGIIEKIFVKDGDFVEKNQTLLKLKDLSLKEKKENLSNKYQELLAKLNRLEALKNNKESINFSKDITKESLKQNELKIFLTIKKSRKDEKEISQQQIEQFKKQISGMKSLIKSKQERLKSIEQDIKEQEALYKERLINKQKLRDLKRERDQLLGDIENMKANILKLQESIAQTKTQYQLNLKKFNEDILKEYTKTKSALNETILNLKSVIKKLKRVNIITPIDGTVYDIDKFYENEVIKPGEVICKVVPKGSKLIIEARVNPKDIDRVKVGLEADIKFPTLDMRHIPELKGKLIYVAPDTTFDNITKKDFYMAKIEITKDAYKILNKNKLYLKVGMPTIAMIKLEKRTMLDYLIKPLKEMVWRSFNEE